MDPTLVHCMWTETHDGSVDTFSRDLATYNFGSLYSLCDAFLCSEGGRIAEPLEGTDSCCAQTRGYVLLVRACILYSAIGLPSLVPTASI